MLFKNAAGSWRGFQVLALAQFPRERPDRIFSCAGCLKNMIYIPRPSSPTVTVAAMILAMLSFWCTSFALTAFVHAANSSTAAVVWSWINFGVDFTLGVFIIHSAIRRSKVFCFVLLLMSPVLVLSLTSIRIPLLYYNVAK